MTHTDIIADGWIAKFLPVRLRPYALLMRLDRPIGVWLLLLPGLWSIALAAGGLSGGRTHDLYLAVLFVVGAVLMRGAGCVINDLWDRDLDKGVERTAARPLASGAVSVGGAAVFLAILLGLSLLILLQMNGLTVLLGFLTIPLIVAYPAMKRITWWPQAFLGITFNFGALMGWAAVSGHIEPAALLLYVGSICWTLGYDTIYAHQDIEDDARMGIKSSARALAGKSIEFIRIIYAAAFAFFIAAFVLAGAGWVSTALLLLPALHLYWQIRRWDMADPASSLRIFKSNRDFGLLVLLASLL